MRDVLCRAAVVAGAAVVLLGSAVGVASASAAPTLTWSRGGNTIISHGFGHVGGADQTASPTFLLPHSGRLRVGAARASGAGSVTMYQDVISGPEGITAGPDGALWFTNSTGNSIGRVTTTGKVATYTGTGISGPSGIVAGPDGALWFTNSTGNSVGRITTTGQVTTYSGTGINTPEGIAAGPDGALWFTNIYGDSIGRITTTGQVTNYPLGGISGPYGITAGPDGALWFTNATSNTIGRITTAGQVTTYGGFIIAPQGITAGPDGALWFTNAGDNQIGRITTTGKVTHYTGTVGTPKGITAGPDGALWFTNIDGGSIGRITTTGQVTSYSGISGPTGVTAGPDGALWFTNSTGNSIWRITTVGRFTSYTHTGISGPEGIAAGPDGALWFTNPGNNSIGRITTKIISTRSFAGYQSPVTAGSATSSAASFTVPTLSCTTAARAITPTAGVAVNSYKSFSVAFVFTGCVNGTAVYYPGLVLNGTETDYPASPISAGDVVNLSTSVTTSGTTVQVMDVTTGVTKKLTGAGASADAAYIGDDGWATSTGTLLGVPGFATLTFTNSLIDGKALASWHPREYLRVNRAGIVQIAPGWLSSAGTAFATYYNHS